MEVTEVQGRKRKQPPGDLKETTAYWRLKQETIEGTLW
jgi:hypothetical protein